MSDLRFRAVAASKTRLLIAGSLLATLVVLGLVMLLSHSSDATGDPGGAILNQLRSVADALPTNLHVDYAWYDEPHQDSCDGNPSTVGWDPVVVQIAVEVQGPSAPVVRAVAGYLKGHGWRAAATSFHPDGWIWPPGSGWNWPSTGEWEWTTALARGRPALADFSNGGSGSQWILSAEAPSILKPPTGC